MKNVLDLVKCNLLELNMSPALQAQVESLLYVAVALASNAKIYHTKKDTLASAKELFAGRSCLVIPTPL